MPQQRSLVRRYIAGRRALIGLVIHISKAATRPDAKTDSTYRAGPNAASHPRSKFAVMNDEQVWMQRLEEFLDYVTDTTTATDPTNAVANVRTVVSRWISHALEHQAHPGERNEELLSEWVTNVLVLDIRPQGDYRSRVGRWWRWCEAQPTSAEAEAVSQAPSERLARLITEFRSDGYDLANEVGHLQARERFEEILRRLPTMSYGDRLEVKEVWRKQPGWDADYGGPGNIVQLSSLVDGVSEAAWEQLRDQLVELCWGTNSLADRLRLAVGSHEVVCT